MNKPALLKYSLDVREGGTILYDSRAGDYTAEDLNVKEGVKVISIPARDIATEVGNAKAMNTAILGALMELGKDSPILTQDAFRNGIMQTFAAKPKLIDVNLEVLEAGAKWLRDNRLLKLLILFIRMKFLIRKFKFLIKFIFLIFS